MDRYKMVLIAFLVFYGAIVIVPFAFAMSVVFSTLVVIAFLFGIYNYLRKQPRRKEWKKV